MKLDTFSFASVLRLAAALPLFVTAHAFAGSLQVSPNRVDLSVEQPAAVMKLHNRGDQPITAQVSVFG